MLVNIKRLVSIAAMLLLCSAGAGIFAATASAIAPAKSKANDEKPLRLKVVDQKTGRRITFGKLTDRLSSVDIICVGERHDSDLHHRVQLQIIKALYARDESLGVGMEMFQQPSQKAIDRYFTGEIDEKQFLVDSDYEKRWGYDFKLYRPIVEFCRRNEVPVAGLNAASELTKRVSKVGFAALTADEQKQLGPVDFNVKAHRNHWFDLLGQMHGTHKPSADQQERSYQVMTIWDDYMAQTATSFRKERGLRKLVILAGANHIGGGFGIPDRAAKYAGATTATIGIVVVGQDEEPEKDLPFDYVIYVREPKGA